MTLTRLKKRKHFLALRDSGNKIVMPCFVLQYAPAQQLSSNLILENHQSAIGFTVTKKLGNAVRRNRIKRRLKEVARLHFQDHAQSGYGYVMIGRYKAYDADFTTITKQCIRALHKIHTQKIAA